MSENKTSKVISARLEIPMYTEALNNAYQLGISVSDYVAMCLSKGSEKAEKSAEKEKSTSELIKAKAAAAKSKAELLKAQKEVARLNQQLKKATDSNKKPKAQDKPSDKYKVFVEALEQEYYRRKDGKPLAYARAKEYFQFKKKYIK